MIIQIARDYGGLNPAMLSTREIAFYYDGLRADLQKSTRGKAEPAPSRKRSKPTKHAR
jgi:hypothetical protein